MKWVNDVNHPEKITVTTIVHIPFLDGYWAQSLDVLKLCLRSMRKSTGIPFDLMVFDNGSCIQVQDYLLDMRRNVEIQYLVLSENNVGKVGAWNFLFLSAPGEIISYTDSDVYFLPGWLEASLKILQVFPEAGMVTAQPIAGGDISSLWTAKAAQKDPSVSIQMGHLIPDEYLMAHLKGINAPPEEYERRQKDRKDALLSRGLTRAYATASHFQFTTTREIAHLLFPVKATVALGDDLQFDVQMRELGFWRLSTTEYLVHHMGNEVPDLKKELPWVNASEVSNLTLEQGSSKRKRVLDKPLVKRLSASSFGRRLLKRVNAYTYKLLYD